MIFNKDLQAYTFSIDLTVNIPADVFTKDRLKTTINLIAGKIYKQELEDAQSKNMFIED